jgi:hypothetical protein
VPDIPERPFVPHRTPKASRQVVVNSEFQLSRPFVPGGTSLPSIGEFIEPTEYAGVSVPFAEVAEAQQRFDGDEDAFDELPPVEHFTDPLPPVTSFAPDARTAVGAAGSEDSDLGEAESVQEESGWIEEDWQHYDWRAAASLGDEPGSDASNEWAKTDWEVSSPVSRDRKPSAAEAIASALDEIAQRIRQGDLAVPAPDALANPAAIAASLAALLGVKR